MTENAAPHAGTGAEILPKPLSLPRIAYAEPSYWDNRYRNQTTRFDWFYGWTALRRAIRAHLPKARPLVQIGCGNSTLQEGMASSGYKVLNLDISPVVIEQMREKHKDIPGLEYAVADCREMPEYRDCQFWGALDKGTIDALLCSKEGVSNVTRMCCEISRVLQPGTYFLAITLGDPSQRLAILSQPQFNWTVQVLLLPRLPAEMMVQIPGRELPVNDTLEPITPLGPFTVGPDLHVEGLPQPWDPTAYFYVYACRKAPLTLQADSKQKGQLSESWRSATRECITKLQLEKGMSGDLFKRGQRTRRLKMKDFLAAQQRQHVVRRSMSADSSGFAALHAGERAVDDRVPVAIDDSAVDDGNTLIGTSLAGAARGAAVHMLAVRSSLTSCGSPTKAACSMVDNDDGGARRQVLLSTCSTPPTCHRPAQDMPLDIPDLSGCRLWESADRSSRHMLDQDAGSSMSKAHAGVQGSRPEVAAAAGGGGGGGAGRQVPEQLTAMQHCNSVPEGSFQQLGQE